MTPSQQLNNFVKAKQSGDGTMMPFKRDEGWISWQEAIELQTKADKCFRILDPILIKKS